ncbi:MAG: hypothetical protein KDC48_21725, partial [Planctomycetes bacterium]|nr:hypothetical protein [Planctomycetota bacterium]
MPQTDPPPAVAPRATRLLVLDTGGDVGRRLAGRGDWQVDSATDSRRLRKLLKRGAAPAIVFLVVDDGDDCADTARLLRVGQRNVGVRLVALAPRGAEERARRLVSESGVDLWRRLDDLSDDDLHDLAAAELRTFRKLRAEIDRREAEVTLIESLARFSRLDLAAETCH